MKKIETSALIGLGALGILPPATSACLLYTSPSPRDS